MKPNDDHYADSNPERMPSWERIVAETQWDELSIRLLGYARSRLSRYRSLDRSIGDQAHDFVQEAMALFFNGTRTYDGEKPLFNWFCSQIDAVTSHYREKAKRRGREVAIEQRADEDGPGSPSADEWLASGENFEQAIIARDELERFVSTLDPDLKRYVLLRIDGTQMTAEECAVAMGTTVERIRNFNRRLRRRRVALTTNKEMGTEEESWKPYA